MIRPGRTGRGVDGRDYAKKRGDVTMDVAGGSSYGGFGGLGDGQEESALPSEDAHGRPSAAYHHRTQPTRA